MKLMIVGAQGQLGRELQRLFEGRFELIPLDRKSLDIRREEQVAEVLRREKPDVLINCSAYNKVDLAEEEREEAMRVNCEGVRFLARHLPPSSHLIHLSTDYVFDGKKKSPYFETDQANPLSAYGKSKKAGEDAVFQERERVSVLRTAWLYSAGGGNFLAAIAAKIKAGCPLFVVNDQIGTPTCVTDLAVQIEKVIEAQVYGILHASAEGECSWYDYALHIAFLLGDKAEIRAVTTDQFKRENSGIKAERPAYSVLENFRLKQSGIHCMKPWKESLARLIGSTAGEKFFGKNH